MKSLFAFWVCLLLGIISVQARQMPPLHHAPDREFDLLNIKLQFQFDISNHSVNGIATEKVIPLRAPLDSLHLNAVGMHIDGIRMNGRDVPYRYDDSVLTLRFGHSYTPADTLTFKIVYDTKPVKGLTFIYPDKGYPGRNSEIWSQSEMEDARYWYPCHDYPDDFTTSEVVATVPENWQVISNGKLESVKTDNTDSTVTFDWVEHKPHVIYLISLIAGRFNRFESHYKDIPIYYYSDPRYGNLIKDNFSRMPDILHFYEDITGRRFAWEKLALATVTNFIWGGEENVSAITLTDQTLHDSLAEPQVSSTSVIAHETAHQWFGDLLTCRNWANSWLNEGFATYFEALYERHAFGNAAFDYEMYRNRQSTISADNRKRQPTVNHRYFAPIDMFNTYIYARGASILDMLHSYLGDTLFDRAIRHYVQKYQFQNVDTHDLENSVSEATGYNMYWFFNQWLYKAGHPDLDVHYQYKQDQHRLFIHVRQVQKTDSLTPVFRLPVSLEVQTAHGKLTRRLWIRKADETLSLPLNTEPLNIELDGSHTLLAEIREHKSAAEWLYQLNNDKNPVSRIIAIRHLSPKDKNSQKAVVNALYNDSFWAVRTECVHWLAASGSKRISKQLRKTITTDQDARVREAAVRELGHYKSNTNRRLIKEIYNSRENYFVRAAAIDALARIDSASALNFLQNALDARSYNHVITETALRAISRVDPAIGYRLAVDYSTYGQPENLRIEALRLLVRTGPGKEKTRGILVNSLDDPYIWIRSGAIRGLGQTGDETVIPILRKEISDEPDGRLRQSAREAIQDIMERTSKSKR